MQNIPGNPLEKLTRIREKGIHVTGGLIVGFDRSRASSRRKKIHPAASGVGIAMVGLHRHADYVENELSRYLSSPPPHDVLDEVARADSTERAEVRNNSLGL